MKNIWLKVSISLLVAVLSTSSHATLSKVEALVNEARAKVETGDLEAAARAYYEALQIDNSNDEVRRELSKVLIKSMVDNPHEEEPGAAKAIIDSNKVSSFPATNFALPFLNNAVLVAEDKEMSPQVLMILKKLSYGDNESAIKMAQILQKKYSKHPVPYNLLGLAWQGLNDPSKAQELYNQALALNENFQAARLNLADLELVLGEFSAAHQEVDKVLKLNARNRRACLLKAQLHAAQGKPELAQIWYSKVSERL